ncbi:hypothetical protein LV779_20145 [Streptomyces thinghirensis]|nr:hypothetical protein [Streptomyces thinghirensis]
MVFSRRMAALAVVLIPLGIAATSFALTDSPQEPKVPAKVELESGSPHPDAHLFRFLLLARADAQRPGGDPATGDRQRSG